MYNEFINGTGCKENDHNYKVYKDLEILYMNSDLTKEQIYEYGKKLVDNSKSEEQIKFENEINEEIKGYKESIAYNNERADDFKTSAWFWKAEGATDLYKSNMDMYRYYKAENKKYRARIRELKSLLVA